MASFVKVATTGELGPGQTKKVEVDGKTIALFEIGGSYHAIDDTCTHEGGPLSEGEVEGNIVTCPWHGAQFNVTNGEVVRPPAEVSVSYYRSRVNGSDIEVEL
ncbi:non-heme iron oxygenase ferredoxin subunit [Candidatus Methylomirabilis sp.]|uniref:Rieske (2Fe-2S) protein n=1 Tax=Candidatus Methylomirabilis sp. TaxID=2032687 RepID=UPI002A62BFAB|nr:non-heme iron oxygenase ferredoxin subunit [Candidatus Methylomirabilis sp.]